MPDKDPDKPEKKSNSGSNKFLRLTSAGLQMGITIFLFAYLGKYLDERYPNEKNIYTAILTIVGVAIAIVSLIRQVNKINSEDDSDK